MNLTGYCAGYGSQMCSHPHRVAHPPPDDFTLGVVADTSQLELLCQTR